MVIHRIQDQQLHPPRSEVVKWTLRWRCVRLRKECLRFRLTTQLHSPDVGAGIVDLDTPSTPSCKSRQDALLLDLSIGHFAYERPRVPPVR